jgi:arsenate reductase
MKGVLFLCVHNAGRSQIAAGFMRALGADVVQVFSAGSEPASLLNPVVVAAMSEVGIDIVSTQPKRWTMEMLNAVDVVVTMGCGDACPYIAGKQYIDWPIADPAGQDLVVVRQIRDEIRQRVEQLIADV